MSEYGKIIGTGEVRLERVLPGPIERVWKYLTDPELRGKWLATGPMELQVAAQLRCTSTMRTCLPKRFRPPSTPTSSAVAIWWAK